MEQEAVASWQVNELRHQLESTHHESQDRAAKAMGARSSRRLLLSGNSMRQRPTWQRLRQQSRSPWRLQRQSRRPGQTPSKKWSRYGADAWGRGVERSTAQEGDPTRGRAIHSQKRPPWYIPILPSVDALNFSFLCS